MRPFSRRPESSNRLLRPPDNEARSRITSHIGPTFAGQAAAGQRESAVPLQRDNSQITEPEVVGNDPYSALVSC